MEDYRTLAEAFSWAGVDTNPHSGLARALHQGRLSPAQLGRVAELTSGVSAQKQDDRVMGVFWAIVKCAPYPVHCRLQKRHLDALVDALTNVIARRGDPQSGGTQWTPVRARAKAGRRVPRKEELLGYFPRKAHPQAGKKANLFLDKMLLDLWTRDKGGFQEYMTVMSKAKRGEVTDDQACSVLLYGWSCRKSWGFRRACMLALLAVLDSAAGKALSNLLKATGNNMSEEGAQLCELHTLQGRGVAQVDLERDALRRIEGGTPNVAEVKPQPDQLRKAVRAILRQELPGEVHLPTLDEHWHSRYKWCVAGNHSVAANRHWLPESQLHAALPQRLTRRMVSENVSHNPLYSWTGRVGVSVSEKLEHGKGRALYSCDTLSYYAFSWLLGPVERKWAGRRVILDPGSDGVLGLLNRVRGLVASSGFSCFAMLDYSDFNSQHSLQSQKIVIEELLEHVGAANTPLGRLLVNSFDNMWVYLNGRLLGRASSTLMSGHRGTSFINSVLNAAYIRLAAGANLYAHTQALHVGDDIVMVVPDEDVGWEVITRLTRMGCTLQQSKQSVGRGGFEFLRVAGHPKWGGVGYAARSIAGLACGNWVTEYSMDPLSALRSLIQQARSIINRSGNPDAYILMVGSACRMTGLPRDVMSQFLSGEVAVAPGPCYRTDGRYLFRYVALSWESRLTRREREWHSMLPRYASRDYIERGCDPIERIGMDMAGYIPWAAMASGSYGRMEPGRWPGNASGRPVLVYSGIGTRVKEGRTLASALTTCKARHGVLSQYPILALLRNELQDHDVAVLLTRLGADYDAANPALTAWGAEGEGVVVAGVLPYGDAAGVGGRGLSGTVLADTKIAM